MAPGSVTRTQTRTVSRRREDVAARVLAAVEELLASGERFTEIPVARIAEASGISRTAFYQYFRNKSEVLVAAAEAASLTFFSAPRTWFAGDRTTTDGTDEIEQAIATMLAEYRTHGTVMRALEEVSGYDDEVAGFWFGIVDTNIDDMTAAVQRWQAQGAVDAALDARAVTTAVTWMVERAIALHVLHPSRAREMADDQLVAALSRQVWLGYFGPT